MALFKTREPRKFHHPYIYINERKEKLKAIEERAKRVGHAAAEGVQSGRYSRNFRERDKAFAAQERKRA